MAKSSTATSKKPAKKAPAKKAPAKKAPAKATSKAPAKAERKAPPKPEKKPRFKKVSRSVTRLVEPGSQVDCSHCDERVKFQAKMRHQQVICNVYEKHQWVRVEHFHADCYKLAGQPFGKPVD